MQKNAMKPALFVVVLFFAASGIARGQGVDSCLCIWGGADSSFWLNPDTIMVDTCRAHSQLPAPAQYVYSKWYEVIFQYAVIKLNASRPDSFFHVPWTAIDTAYPTLRNICRQLDSEYGGLLFTKLHPEIGDSTNSMYNEFVLYLNHYAPVDSIGELLGSQNQPARVYYDQPVPAIYGVSVDTPSTRISLIFTDPEHVYIQGAETRVTYSVFDQIGRVIFSGEFVPGSFINLSSLRSGLYFLRMEGKTACCFKIFH